MKFAHLADVHIGSWRDPKLKEMSTLAFIKSIDLSIEEKVDFILISGDLFNTALPGIDQIKIVIRKLKEIKEKGISVYFIAGSHDFSPSGKTMLDIIEEADLGINVTKGEIIEKENGESKLKLLFTTDKKTGAKITGMIGKRGMLEKKYYEDLDRDSLESEQGFRIFMFHTALDELKPEDLSDMPSTPVSFLPRGFDYYAGGHVHIVKQKNLEEHGYKNLVYPGPIFPANFTELEKLGVGGFFIYENGKITRKEITIKESISFNIKIDNKTVEEARAIIEESLVGKDIINKIILLRIHGSLKSGKSSDIDFNSMFERLYEKGAYFIMKNSSKLISKEFSEVMVSHASSEELEDKLIQEHLNQTEHKFNNELESTKQLLKTFSEEKHEGEKVSDYDSRIKKEVDIILK
ncbi:hypothetical protein COV13_01335 [Candidatus Woesearchaeota archaeon CG10_big_fil_rev_8_21_14_0_10_32_9]|nr:MAG: hypothetical protein COV13_01335 [Candidatus Woesearchaeota archaeon CG10_big_fil_rev_8_21_14_0_10_32_9]